MTTTPRVILEMGQKRRVVAGAMDWPGLDRGPHSTSSSPQTASLRIGVRTSMPFAPTTPKAGGADLADPVPRAPHRPPGAGRLTLVGDAARR